MYNKLFMKVFAPLSVAVVLGNVRSDWV